jgi:hypothetical protein
MSDRDIQNWDQRLKDQVLLRWENYVRRRIDLSIARAAQFWALTGEYVYVEKVSSASAKAAISFNRNTNDQLELVQGTEIKTVFEACYITNIAQPGEWIDLLIGINFEYRKRTGQGRLLCAQPAVKLTHANANTNVTPSSQICTQALIKADVQNTGIAWIDFGTAAVQNACLPLDPGDWTVVDLSNLDLVNANFEVGGECVFIVYEL